MASQGEWFANRKEVKAKAAKVMEANAKKAAKALKDSRTVQTVAKAEVTPEKEQEPTGSGTDTGSTSTDGQEHGA